MSRNSLFRQYQNNIVVEFAKSFPFKKIIEFGSDESNDYRPYFDSNIEFIKSNVHGKYDYYDLTNLKLLDSTVDGCLCISVLQHVYNIDVAISEIIRVLAPGGRCLITNGFMFPICMSEDYYRLTPAYWKKRLEMEPVDFEIKLLGNQYSSIDNMLMRPYGKFFSLKHLLNKLLSFPFKILKFFGSNHDSAPLGIAIIITKR